VILSNLKLNHAEIAVSTPNRDIPTGLRKFGAIVGDRTEVGCNSVINPGSVIGRDCMIYPTVNFRGVLPDGSMVKLRQKLQVLKKTNESNLYTVPGERRSTSRTISGWEQ
jgi:acetyltransferase-like isoleucine patch superfamily enzyme